MHPIFERFKERKIVQWALAYVAGAVALYSALDAFAEPWGVGDFQLRIAQVGLLVGFFVAVTLAWYHGERGEQRVTGVELLILAGIMGLGAIGVRLVGMGGPVRVVETGEAFRMRLPRLAPNHAPLADFEFGPDSTGFTYALRPSGGPKWYRAWDEDDGRPIEGSIAGNNLVSPDGLFFSEVSRGRELRIISLRDGGMISREMEIWAAALWGGDGYLYFTGPDSSIYRVAENLDGDLERLGLERAPGDGLQEFFNLLPGGRKAIFQVRGPSPRIEGVDLRTMERRTLVENGTRPHVTRTGHLVFADLEGRIMAAALDPDELSIGPAVPMIDRRASSGVSALEYSGISWSLSSDGTLGYWEDTPASTNQMMLRGTEGYETPVEPGWTFEAGTSPQWKTSSDGSRVAYRDLSEGSDIRVRDLIRGTDELVTVDEVGASWPGWLTETEVGYVANGRTLMSARADGATAPRAVVSSDRQIATWSKGPEGTLFLEVFEGSGNRICGNMPERDIVLWEPQNQSVQPLLADPRFSEQRPALRPDGSWLAYTRCRASGLPVLTVRPYPQVSRAAVTVSSAGGFDPAWSADGLVLYYIGFDERDPTTGERYLIAASVSSGAPFEVLRQDTLFSLPEEYRFAPRQRFEPTPDPERFRLVRMTPSDPHVVLIRNWFAELRARVPN